MAVHGGDFTSTGLEEDLFWIRDLMKFWFEIKVRAGPFWGRTPGMIRRWLFW